jgi:hypothetical protein
LVAILVGSRDHRTQFWKGAIQIVSVSAVLYPRWPPLLKIEISSNGQNCSILSQKVPKFELYNHNELFNIHYGIFWSYCPFFIKMFSILILSSYISKTIIRDRGKV